jgi:phosphatidylinositol alpha-1,6-mannosyltransferase
MRWLLVVPELGVRPGASFVPGGLQQFGRCVARALASSPAVSALGVWAQVDHRSRASAIRQLVQPYASEARLAVRCFGGKRDAMSAALLVDCLRRRWDAVMYLLVNQAVLGALPGHPPYVTWVIGREVFEPLTAMRRRALRRAAAVFSISKHTADEARRFDPTLAEPRVVYPCVEPGPPGSDADDGQAPYDLASRRPAILIVGNMHRGLLYKGHQQLIAAWPLVLEHRPDAELWIAGDGAGRGEIERMLEPLPWRVASRIRFFGGVDDAMLQKLYASARAFAMPSEGEGFGLVFVEAARCGLPAIGGRFDSVKEIVLDGVTGFTVEQHPYDVARAAIRLLCDDALAARFSRMARQRYVDEFRFPSFRRRLLAAVEAVVA